MSQSRHVTVIGAGVVGICCALYLRRTGHDVTVLDPGGPGEGASQSNSGHISSGSCVPSSTPGIIRQVPKMLLDPLAPLAIRWTYLPWIAPWLIRFVRAAAPGRVEAISRALKTLLDVVPESYEPLLADSAAGGYIRTGGVLYTYQSDASFADAQWGLELRRRRGVEFDVLHGAEIQRVEPSLVSTVKHAVFYRKTRFCTDPLGLMRALAAHLIQQGGRFEQDKVTGVELGPAGPRWLQTTGGRRPVDLLVLAAGAWSRDLAARLGGRVPLDTERGYVVMLPRPGVTLQIPVLSGDYHCAITPMEVGVRLAGTVELAGLHAAPNYARARVLVECARRVLGEVDSEGAIFSMGFRPSMPDSLPVIGPSPRYPSVFFAFGHGHLGLTFGAATGRLIAEMIDGRPTCVDMTPFRADRF